MQHTILAISGEPATGKSMLAAAVVARCGVSFDTDTLCAPLRDAALGVLGLPASAVDGVLYRQRLRPAVYQCLVDTALHLVSQVGLVVIDGPFHPGSCGSQFWEEFDARATKQGARLVRAHLVADPDVVRQRMAVRAQARDVGKLADWDAHRAYWAVPPPSSALVIDATPADFCAAAAAALVCHVNNDTPGNHP